MSQGIRIRHNKARGGLFPVPLPHKPFPTDQKRPVCGACLRASGKAIQHMCKTVHVMLDDTGAAIVSKEIWEDFRRVYNSAGFVLANPVLEPPAQTLSPATIKMRIDAVEFGTVPEKQRKQYSTGSGRMTRTEDQAPHIMGLDEYVDKAAQKGISRKQALDSLLVAALKAGG